MLLGNFEGIVSDVRRVAFPKRYRDILGNKLIITKGLDNNLIAVSENNWKTLLEGSEDKPFTNKNARELQAFLLGNASFVELDDQGRFILPDYLTRHAVIVKEVIFVGMNKYVQIWDKKSWQIYQERIKKNIDVNIENLSRDE